MDDGLRRTKTCHLDRKKVSWTEAWMALVIAALWLALFMLMPDWLRNLSTLAAVMVVIAIILVCWKRKSLLVRMTATGTSSAIWSGADYVTLDLVRVLDSPRVVNWHLYKAGLFAKERANGPSEWFDTASLLSRFVEAYRNRPRAGFYIVDGERLTMPRLVRVERTSLGPVALFSSIPGSTEASYSRATEALKTSLRVKGLRIEQLPKDIAEGVMRFTFVTMDPLESLVPSAFLDDNPAHSPLRLPLGVTEAGAIYCLSMHHTLIVGASGSGKGSVLQGIVRQLASLHDLGLVRLWGGDAKNSELRGFDRTSLFERVCFDAGEQAAMLNDLVANVLRPKQATAGRSFVLSAESPLDVILLDEFSSLLRDPAFKPGHGALSILLSQGRSAGVYVIAASQEGQKSILENFRIHFANRIALRLEQAVEVDMVMGGGALDQGAKPHLIEPASEFNGYRTAGIAYVKSDASPRPDRVRFAYTSDRDIQVLLRRYGKGQDQPSSSSN